MAQKTFGDSSTGDVVITPGSSSSSGGGGGFFSIGGGGGFGGGFGGSSRRRRKKRARARAAALARGKAEEQARQAAAAAARAEALATAHRQRVQTYSQARERRRVQLDTHFSGQSKGLAQALQREIDAARKSPIHDPSERWQLYLISKARNEIDGLISAKQLELAKRQALASTFAGHGMAADAFAARLASLATPQQMQQLHSDWERAYVAASEAGLLQEAIKQLAQRSSALVAEHAQQEKVWRAREAVWARQHQDAQQYAQQREARVRYKQQADEDRRLQRLKAANTLGAPVGVAQAGGVLLTQGGAQVAAELAAAIEQAIANAAKELLRVAAIRGGQALSLTATAMLYSPTLGNGELTEAQRRRHLEGLGVGAELLGVEAGQDLQAIANAGGSARLSNRIRIEHLPGGSGIGVASTGAGIASEVRVRNAVFDPVNETYRVEPDTPTGKTLVLGGSAATAGDTSSARVLALAPEVATVGAGVDLRFDDCIVCIPGQAPQYFSFVLPPAGTGVVTGKGQVAGGDWWAARVAPTGVALPAQVGDQLRGRTFTSLPAFESAVWRAVAADEGVLRQFDELNQRRMLNGYPPVAAKSAWSGGRQTFELRHVKAAGVGSGLYNLDQMRIHAPASPQGIVTAIQPFKPWFVSSVSMAFDEAIVEGQPVRTWTPLVAPGAELLGPTLLPQAPPLEGSFPGAPADPLGPSLEILPGEDPSDTGATIPGFGGDDDLPSPGLVNYEPVVLGETGEYPDLSRRSTRDDMDVDHVPSTAAILMFFNENAIRLRPYEMALALRKSPCVVIPTETHRKQSETYGRRNSKEKIAQDASDLFAAIDSNIEAYRESLIEGGLAPARVDEIKAELTEKLRVFIEGI